MCGIFACISNGFTTPFMREQGKKCNHRGPDSTMEYKQKMYNQNIFFMFHRLAINGLDKLSNQPFNIDNVILMCNGEIYNFDKLAKDYNIKLETNSDCEIILHLYKLLGLHKTISLLDGVFSFVLYDTILQKIYIGHDPIGIRSLYMSTDDGLYVSSELKCLVNFQKHVDMVKPGVYHTYDIETKNHSVTSYFQLDSKPIFVNDETCIKLIQTNLKESVKKRLLSDQPIGCLLSGGLDSSIITSLMCKFNRPSSVKTFSIGFQGSPDLISAKKVADYLKTNHTEIIVTEEDMLSAIEPTIKQIESYDTTTVRASTPMYLLSKYIQENTDIKVILSGEGADELSGSYLYFHNAPTPHQFQIECERLINDVQHFDVLRCDKTTAGNSLEVRVPFFDKVFAVDYMNIEPSLKVVRDGYEKYLLRKSFENDLPNDIVWRRKDGFSDGVSLVNKPWYQIIQDYTQKNYQCSEKEYYQKIFSKYYKNYEYICPYEWLPKWSKESNPSGRLLLNE